MELSQLNNRLIELSRLEQLALDNNKIVPPGRLRIASKSTCADYYHVVDENNSRGIYISKNNMNLIKGLANKRYNEQILDSVKKERKAIEQYIRNMPEYSVEEMYDMLSVHRKKLVCPIVETKEQFIERYAESEYPRKGFGNNDPEYYTELGERVRSKSEILIANALKNAEIPYLYERPVCLKSVGYIYTDFTILDVKNRKVRYWEHFGRMEEEKYINDFLLKISTYYNNGIILGDNLFATFESKNHPLKTKDIDAVIASIQKTCEK